MNSSGLRTCPKVNIERNVFINVEETRAKVAPTFKSRAFCINCCISIPIFYSKVRPYVALALHCVLLLSYRAFKFAAQPFVTLVQTYTVLCVSAGIYQVGFTYCECM